MVGDPFKPVRRGPFNLVSRVIWSLKGFRETYQSEASFRSWVYANVLSAGLALYLPIEPHERLLIIVLGLLILGVELINTAIEHLADEVDPTENARIAACKDAASAGVAIVAIAAGVAWVFAGLGLAGF